METRRVRLASRSSRRADLLRAAGVEFEAGPFPDVDETPPSGLAPGPTVEALAVRKAEAAAALVPGSWVLAGDTLVFLDGVALGKPCDEADAHRMLAALSGRAHEVASGVALARADPGGLSLRSAHDVTSVRFRALGTSEIAAYVATGEPLDKAGAYGIQGGAADFVAALDGARDTVIGLPMDVVRRLLRETGSSA